MKPIDVKYLGQYTSFVTRLGKEATLLNYIPEGPEKCCLLFLVDKNIVGTDANGKCWSVNAYSAEYADTNYLNYDIFFNNKVEGWINISLDRVENKDYLAQINNYYVYKTYELAKQDVAKDEVNVKTIKVEWNLDE